MQYFPYISSAITKVEFSYMAISDNTVSKHAWNNVLWSVSSMQTICWRGEVEGDDWRVKNVFTRVAVGSEAVRCPEWSQ